MGKLIIVYFRGYIPREGKAVHRVTVCPTGRGEEGRMERRKRKKKEGEGSELIGSHVLSPGLSI